MPFSKTPALNLKAVLQETGIAADTLRAWERRYGLPMPDRTSGGHRLYSQYDVETIKWLIAKQLDGLSISRAVDMWNEIAASNTDPLAVLDHKTFSSPQQHSIDLPPETSLAALRANWLSACMKFNEVQAEQTLNQAFAMHSVEAVCAEVLQKGLSEIGNQWFENNASVQQEHFASALAMRRLESLLSASPAPTRKETILVGCPANEWHTFTPLLLSLLLRRRGYNVIYLGANVPADRLGETAKATHSRLVILIAQQLTTAASLLHATFMLAEQGINVAFGGRIFTIHPQIVKRMAGYYLGNTLEAAVGKIEFIDDESMQILEPDAVSREYIAAAVAFHSRRSQIESDLSQKVGSLGFGAESMQSAAHYLGDTIAAALQLGDMSMVDAEMDWTRNLLKGQRIPAKALSDFLNLYAEAVYAHINGTGKPIIEWIQKNA